MQAPRQTASPSKLCAALEAFEEVAHGRIEALNFFIASVIRHAAPVRMNDDD
jgi:hypothetical protein